MTESAIAAVESRAFAARITMQDLCARAKVHQSVWSRAKARGTIRVRVLSRVEDALDAVEAERAQATS